jgi:hypothetical protein
VLFAALVQQHATAIEEEALVLSRTGDEPSVRDRPRHTLSSLLHSRYSRNVRRALWSARSKTDRRDRETSCLGAAFNSPWYSESAVREEQMRKLLVASALIAAFCMPALAGNQNGVNQNGNPQNRAAPGPIAGAGLPILAVGCVAYWLVRRYRRKSDNGAS